MRGRVGLLAHDPLLYRELSARENLGSTRGCTAWRWRGSGALLEQVGLRARADEPVRTLSRGMAQRVAICRASLHEPELLLLDEPLANLDPGAAEAVEPLIGRNAGRRASSSPTTWSTASPKRTSSSACSGAAPPSSPRPRAAAEHPSLYR